MRLIINHCRYQRVRGPYVVAGSYNKLFAGEMDRILPMVSFDPIPE